MSNKLFLLANYTSNILKGVASVLQMQTYSSNIIEYSQKQIHLTLRYVVFVSLFLLHVSF